MWKKCRVFFRRLRRMSLRRMWMHVRAIHEETGRARLPIFIDMLWCSVRYGVGYLDYHVFGFAGKKAAVRKTYMTMNHNLLLVRRLNDRDYYYVFDDKTVFDERFQDCLGRAWLDLRKTDAAGLAAFCKDKATVFAKAAEKCGGEDIQRVVLTEDTDFDDLYRTCMDKGQWLIEEAIVQHPDMNKLCPTSINTVRIVTLLMDDGAHFVYALVRMGNGVSCVDNISSGGLYTGVDGQGKLTGPAFCDKTGLYYDAHPLTGTAFLGFQIPCFDEAVALCKQAATREPHMRYIGWDVAITPNGPVFVEGNNLPGYDMCQNARHRESGVLPLFESILGEPIR